MGRQGSSWQAGQRRQVSYAVAGDAYAPHAIVATAPVAIEVWVAMVEAYRNIGTPSPAHNLTRCPYLE